MDITTQQINQQCTSKGNMKVNEIFGPTVQGEGHSQGREVHFLRLSFCNLQCSWCDSKYTWDWKQFDRTKEVHVMENFTILEKLKDAKSLVISGGEPLLQQKELVPLIKQLRNRNVWVEIETNGTIIPCGSLLELVNQFNCSPKLSNSGDLKHKRVKPQAMWALSSTVKTYFKFVISRESDIVEVLEYVETFKIKPDHVYLMPLGKTPDELEVTSAMTEQLARSKGFIYSSRLHIQLWGQKRGV